MKGEVYKIWENETKDNKVFHVVEIAGERYSVWEPSLLEGVEEGSRVEYDWQKSGNFKKLTDLKKIDPEPEADSAYRPNRKSMEIVRMSCLKSASRILDGLYMDPIEKTHKAIGISRVFEKYVLGTDADV